MRVFLLLPLSPWIFYRPFLRLASLGFASIFLDLETFS